ncbi:hypothetical protein TNCV_2174331 [Trichonephila clavipes]|nr:hypothetical protein TNCV_2174331 [Trichonephila clavipes]
MSRSGGQSEAGPLVFKSPSNFGTHLSIHCSRYERLSRPCSARQKNQQDSAERSAFARGSRPAASEDELLLRIQEMFNSLPQADIQNLFDSVSRRIAALVAARGGCTKY